MGGRGGFISMLSKLEMCADPEVFILAYHVWMKGRNGFGDQVIALFFLLLLLLNHYRPHGCV